MNSLIATVLLLTNGLAAAWVITPPTARHSAALFASTSGGREQQMEFMDKDPGNLVGDSPDLAEDLMLVKAIVKAADGRKADDIVALEVAHISTLTSYMVFLSGNSRPQNQAICGAILKDIDEEFGIKKNPQGGADSGWMVLDYGGVMVHVMTPKSRLYYNVEGQWREKGGNEIDMSAILIPNKVEQPSSDTMEGLAEEEDPFWS